MTKLSIGLAASGAALVITAASGAASAAAPLTVVELFTSQGCSSCPPADANVIAIAGRPDILALSFGVTYWNSLGWKDTFAQLQFTRRQADYERPLGHTGPFTPQVVVNGRADVVGARKGEIEALVAREVVTGGPAVQVTPGFVAVGPGHAPGQGADVWLVRYDPHVVQVPIRAGENGGRTLPQVDVVHALLHLGTWSGAAARFAVPPAERGLATAVLIQAEGGGPILAAARG